MGAGPGRRYLLCLGIDDHEIRDRQFRSRGRVAGVVLETNLDLSRRANHFIDVENAVSRRQASDSHSGNNQCNSLHLETPVTQHLRNGLEIKLQEKQAAVVSPDEVPVKTGFGDPDVDPDAVDADTERHMPGQLVIDAGINIVQ